MNGLPNFANSVEPQPPGTAAPGIEKNMDIVSEFSHFEAFDPATCQWRTYAERLQNHFELYDVADPKRVRVLIDRVGNATYEQLRKLCAPDNPLNKTADELFELLNGHFHPPTNKYRERIKFHRRVIRPEETLQEFAAELRKMAQNCDFPAHWLPDALRTQFTHGIRNNDLRGMIYEMGPVDFDKIVEFATSVKLPLPAPKKANPTPPNQPNPPKTTKEAKQTAPAPAPKPAPPKPAAAPQAKKRVQAKQAKKAPFVKRPAPFKTPFPNQFRPQPFVRNPPWQDYDDGYSSSYGNQYGNDYSNSNQRFVESTYKPNESLFYRR